MQAPVSLQPYNTFGIAETAAAFVTIRSEADLQAALADERLPRPFRVLGGGSNILLRGPVPGTVLHNAIPGRVVVADDGEEVLLQCGGGENWHQLVLHSLEQGLYGLENLALIPGTVGAAPIQNIGAYGVEVKDLIYRVRFVNFADGRVQELEAVDCAFGYRDSIFKKALKDRGMITRVTFLLHRIPRLHLSYGALRETLAAAGIAHPTPQQVAEAVMHIRKSKLPDPAVTGNAGSFFKNPTLPEAQYEALLQRHPDLPGYPAGEGRVKVPAGWLIEQCGWKGRHLGPAGVHPRQALVLVNRGGARGADIWNLSEAIIADVRQQYHITLEREVQVW